MADKKGWYVLGVATTAFAAQAAAGHWLGRKVSKHPKAGLAGATAALGAAYLAVGPRDTIEVPLHRQAILAPALTGEAVAHSLLHPVLFKKS